MGLLATGGGFLASYVAAEILARLLEDWTGDPEAAVQRVLDQAQQRAQVGATLAFTQGDEVKQSVAQAFGGLRPERTLTQMAMLRGGMADVTPDSKPVLSYVSEKLGLRPEELVQRSSPARMGDYTSLQMSIPGRFREQ